MTDILMPALSPTMTEGKLARWLKKVGDTVKSGDVIAEIETDKATMEVEAVDEGTVTSINVAEGTEGVAVNSVIAVLDGGGGAAPSKSHVPEPPRGEEPKPTPRPAAAAEAPPKAAVNGHDPAPAGGRIVASPLARRLAKLGGIDLASVKGSGPHGRIVKADVDAAKAAPPKPATEAPAAAATPAPAASKPAAPKPAAPVFTAPHKVVPHSSMRKVIARRLSEAKASIPHFYASVDVELDAALKLRAELNAKSPKDGPGAFKLSVNDLVIKAVAVALRRMPHVNAAWTDDGMVVFDDVDVSVAVSIPDGLITPIIRKADIKGLAAISAEMKDLGARAKAGKLKPEEFQGGSFTISNMGMMGVRDFSAIINPPQAGILAVSAGEQRPVVRDGALDIATVMSVTISVDHRVIDGALAAEWLGVFKAILQDPLQMML